MFFETENVSTWGGLEPPTFGFMPNALTYWAIRARHLLSLVIEHWLWWYRYFKSKVNIWYVNCVRATAFIFDTRTGILVKVSKYFETENVSTWGGLEPPTFGCMPNALAYWTIRARHFLSHVFEHWLWRYSYFWSKVNIWYVNCARATAFIFDTRTGALVKVSKFLGQKMSRPEGDSNPQPSDSTECSNLLSYQGQTFAVPCFWAVALAVLCKLSSMNFICKMSIVVFWFNFCRDL